MTKLNELKNVPLTDEYVLDYIQRFKGDKSQIPQQILQYIIDRADQELQKLVNLADHVRSKRSD